MPRKNKKVVKVTYSIDKNISEMIDKYNEESFIPKTKIVEEAVKEYIEKRRQYK